MDHIAIPADHPSRREMSALRSRAGELERALIALVAAEDASIDAFGHKEIDNITAAMEQARKVLTNDHGE